MKQNLFELKDYKDFLRAQIQENRARPGYKARLSRAMETPASFLSQVLHSHVHLSLDHGLKLSRFWSLGSLEQAYFMELISFARAATSELRDYLQQKIGELRQRSQDLSSRFEKPKIETTENQWTYYTAWHFAAIHLLLTIPEFRTIEKISARLRIPTQMVVHALEQLREMRLVEKQGDRWMSMQNSIHLPKSSPASPVNHWIWRQRAIEALYQGNETDLHYTALHTLSRKDLAEVRGYFLRSVNESRKIVEKSKEEGLICVSLDVFEL